ncbi:MAG TPA: site-specific integrase [Candidatus Saccharimonadales bacterium]|nr:site-specific integrase [Candidatus Saccharimonadales bacterium]
MANLTAKSIEALKAKSDRYAVRDDSTPGLELRVAAGGTKTFAVRYTLPDGTRRRMNLGRWPAMDLKDAREAALDAMSQVAKGGDPALKRKIERYAARTKDVRTLDDLAEALFEAGGVRPSTMEYRKWLWAKHLKPRMGDIRIGDTAAGTVRRELREIGSAAGPTTANRALGLLQRMFNFGEEEEHLHANPLAKVRPLFDEASRARVLSDDELRRLWRAAKAPLAPTGEGDKKRDELGVSRAMAIAILLCLLTGQRGGEVTGIRRGELDLDGKTWVLPAERSKSNREHLVPLSGTVVDLIKEAWALADTRLTAKATKAGEHRRKPQPSDPLFPSPRDPSKPIERLSLTRAMARLTESAEIEDATPHDLRRTMATTMASERIGVLTEVVSRVLNHAPPGIGVTGIYNRHAYVTEKRSALDRWEGLLLEIVGERVRPSNVKELRTGLS